MNLLYPWSDYLSDLRRIRFLCLPKPAHSIILLDIHRTGLTFRVGAAVLPSQPRSPLSHKEAQKKFSHKKAQKSQNRFCFGRAQMPSSFCAFCAFLWLNLHLALSCG
jgi:hypothetical protein